MDLWMKIGTAVLLVAMLVFLWPRAKQMVKESPKGSGEDWRSFILVLLAVALFIAVLVMLL